MDLDGTLLQTCAIALVTGCLVYWFMKNRKYNFPPGPPALPLLGSLTRFETTLIHQEIFRKHAKKYGPVVNIRIGTMQILFVNNTDLALEVLVRKSTDFASRIQRTSMSMVTEGFKDLAMASYGPAWQLHKKVTGKALRHFMKKEVLEHRIHDVMKETLANIGKETGPFDPVAYIDFVVGNILAGACFGIRLDVQEIRKFFEAFQRYITLIDKLHMEDIFPWLQHIFKSQSFKKLEEAKKDVYDGFIEPKFKEQKLTFDRANIRHIVDALLLARLEAMEEEEEDIMNIMTDTHLVQICADIVLAGTDTTRYSLSYAILHMVAYPHIQTKVQEELDRVVGRDRMPSVSDRPNLCYTEAVIRESLRLGSQLPTGVIHMTTCDTDLAGYHIPKGTMVAINHWALHHDPEVWKDVENFIPERFLDEDGKLASKPANWLPFSAGKRVCLGESVAKIELLLILACLLQKYKFHSEPGKIPDVSPNGTMFCQVPKPYKVVVEKRF